LPLTERGNAGLMVQRPLKLGTAPVVAVRLVREAQVPYDGRPVIEPRQAASIASGFMADLDREHFVVLTLDVKMKLIGINVASVGTTEATLVHGREVFKAAILQNASRIIVCHNHPSGDPTPSQEDFAATRDLCYAGRVLGIPVLDHIIVAPNGAFASVRETNPGLFG